MKVKHVVGLVHREGNIFGIAFPDLPGCVSTAETLDSVLVRGAQALKLHLTGSAEDGALPAKFRSADEVRADASLVEDLADAILVEVPIPME